MQDLELIRKKIEAYYSESYRRIWIQKSAKNSQIDLLITLFPITGAYKIFSIRNISEVNYEEIFNRISIEINSIEMEKEIRNLLDDK